MVRLNCLLLSLMLTSCAQSKAESVRSEPVKPQLLCTSSVAQCENEAVAGYLSKSPSRHEEAYPLLQELCFDKSAVACEALGIWQAGYGHIGFDLRWDDRAQGAKNLRFACEHGRALACTNLGVSYGEGNGLPQDQSLAVKYYGQGCDLGNGRGCANLAFRHTVGVGVAKDTAKSRQLDVRACELNDGLGCTNMGLAFVADDDDEQALIGFRKACEFNRLDGCAHYVNTLFRLEEMDSEEASKAYDELCELGEAQGCIHGALMALESDHGIERGITLAAKACSGGGGMRGCGILADIYQGKYGGTPNFEKSNHFYEVTCNDWRRRGHNACLSLAENVENGNGVPIDLERAAALRERARELDF